MIFTPLFYLRLTGKKEEGSTFFASVDGNSNPILHWISNESTKGYNPEFCFTNNFNIVCPLFVWSWALPGRLVKKG